jgi:hypothetical protein
MGPSLDPLNGEGYGSRSAERTGELGEDGQVGVQPDPIQATDAERGERPLGGLSPPRFTSGVWRSGMIGRQLRSSHPS